MRKDVMMISAGLMMLAMASCDQTEYREITEDRVVPQPVDTIKVADHFYLDGYLSRTSEDIGGRQLNAVNLFSAGEELYVANFAGKCIDVFDAETLELKRSMSNGDRTLARDVYAEGDHLFVAAGDSREVQIFEKKTGKYLSRLGTGSWPASNVSWAGCVCATPRLVFVRDSKETNIRVFDREALDMNAANNNNVYAKLATGSYFIGSKFEPQSESYDMEAIGDSLYSFIPRTGTIYAWKVQDIIEKKNDAPAKITQNATEKIRSISKTDDKEKFFVSMEKDGKMQLAEYTLADIQKRDFSQPIRSFASDGRVSLPSQTIVTYQKEKLILTNGSVGHAKNVAGKLGILDQFEDIFDIVHAGFLPKPERATYENFLAKHSVDPGRAAMFEDIEKNLLVPSALGMKTVLIVPRTPDPDDETLELFGGEMNYVVQVVSPEDEVGAVDAVLRGAVRRLFAVAGGDVVLGTIRVPIPGGFVERPGPSFTGDAEILGYPITGGVRVRVASTTSSAQHLRAAQQDAANTRRVIALNRATDDGAGNFVAPLGTVNYAGKTISLDRKSVV